MSSVDNDNNNVKHEVLKTILTFFFLLAYANYFISAEIVLFNVIFQMLHLYISLEEKNIIEGIEVHQITIIRIKMVMAVQW